MPLPLLTDPMETPTKCGGVPDVGGDEHTSSGEWGSRRTEDAISEEGIGAHHSTEVTEYELVRQANLRKNFLKLESLGIPVLCASLNRSTTTHSISGPRTTSVVAGEVSHDNKLRTRSSGGAISHGTHNNGLGYINPKP